jgi:molecular chaperone DnaK
VRQSITVTASSGLTPEELARILDAQRDFLLEARTSEEVRLKRQQLETALRETEQLLPEVRKRVGGDHFQGEVLRNAERTLAEARQALLKQELGALAQALDPLTRTLSVFRGMVTPGGQGAPRRS